MQHDLSIKRLLAFASMPVIALSLLASPVLADDDDDDRDRDRVSTSLKVKCYRGESIQAALDRAEGGNTVKVYGNCTENVTIRKDGITLQGVGGASIAAAENTTETVRVFGSRVAIRDLTITGGLRNIRVSNGGGATIERNDFSGGEEGAIIVTETSYARIQDNGSQSLADQNGPGIRSNGFGIAVRMSSSATIRRNLIRDNVGSGIVVVGSMADIGPNRIRNTAAGTNPNVTFDDGHAIRMAFSRVRLNAANILVANDGFGVSCVANASLRVDADQIWGSTVDKFDQGNGCVFFTTNGNGFPDP